MKNFSLPRIDKNPKIEKRLIGHCRLKKGEIWEDPVAGHRVGCLDAASSEEIDKLMDGRRAVLAIHDPPYNLVAFEHRKIGEFIDWCAKWIETTHRVLVDDSSLYIWLGADQSDHFSPLAEFMILMRSSKFRARIFVTMRN